VSQPFDAWSFCRDVLVRGAAIEQDTRATGRGYEQHSFRLDAAAREFAERLKPLVGDQAKLKDLLGTAVEYLESDERDSVRQLVAAIREALK
jgi:hypothetical protein